METAKSFQSKNKGRGTVINLEQGKIPPQAIELEEAVLGKKSSCACFALPFRGSGSLYYFL